MNIFVEMNNYFLLFFESKIKNFLFFLFFFKIVLLYLICNEIESNKYFQYFTFFIISLLISQKFIIEI